MSYLSIADRNVGRDHPDWFKVTGSAKKRVVKLNFPQPTTQKQSKKYVTGMKSLRVCYPPCFCVALPGPITD
jgi:hypothetical protein